MKKIYYSSSDNDSFCFEGYVNEPEYSKAELDAMNYKVLGNVSPWKIPPPPGKLPLEISPLGNVPTRKSPPWG